MNGIVVTSSPFDHYAYSTDGESYTGHFKTVEEALEAAKRDEPETAKFFIGKATIADPTQYVEAEVMLDHILCQDEFCSDWSDGWPNASPEQEQELTDALRAAFTAWMEKHNLRPDFYTVHDAQMYEAQLQTEEPK